MAFLLFFPLTLFSVSLSSLVEEEHYRMALALAEKYEDFSLMILICERENNSQKLEKYKIAFAEKVLKNTVVAFYFKQDT